MGQDIVKNSVGVLLKKEMGRKEFLAHIGAALLVLVGVSGLLKILLDMQTHRNAGYGSSTFGGKD